jgi:hypothetical protein
LIVITTASAADVVVAGDDVEGMLLVACEPALVGDAPHPVSATISPTAAIEVSPCLIFIECLSDVRLRVNNSNGSYPTNLRFRSSGPQRRVAGMTCRLLAGPAGQDVGCDGVGKVGAGCVLRSEMCRQGAGVDLQGHVVLEEDNYSGRVFISGQSKTG